MRILGKKPVTQETQRITDVSSIRVVSWGAAAELVRDDELCNPGEVLISGPTGSRVLQYNGKVTVNLPFGGEYMVFVGAEVIERKAQWNRASNNQTSHTGSVSHI